MQALISGLIVCIVSLFFLFKWFPDLIKFLKGSLPLMFFLGGIIAIIAGITAIMEKIRESKEEKSSPATTEKT